MSRLGARRQAWLASSGPRWYWRLALFIPLFLVLIQVQLWLAPRSTEGPLAEDALSLALIWQGVILFVAALVAAWVLLRALERRPLTALGLPLDRHVPAELGSGFALGAAAVAVVVALLSVFGAYSWTGDAGSAVGWLGVQLSGVLWFAVPAAAEELVFRGYAFRTLAQGIGPVYATAFFAPLFAFVHAGNPNISSLALLNLALAGVVLSLAMVRTGSLWYATAVHLGWNWASVALLDLPVSGLDALDTPLYEPTSHGPDWLTGGAFGPEGGLAGTAAALVAFGLVWWHTSKLGAPLAALAPRETRRET